MLWKLTGELYSLLNLFNAHPHVSVFLWQLKSLFPFLPPIHMCSMKTLAKNRNAWCLKALSKVENFLICADMGQYYRLEMQSGSIMPSQMIAFDNAPYVYSVKPLTAILV